MLSLRLKVAVPLLGLLMSCAAGPEPDDQGEWQAVMSRKKAASSPAAGTREKQVYADSVAAFVQRHPDHGRAREVYQRIQLEFAGELRELGRYQDSIRVYRSVLTRDPRSAEASAGMQLAFDRLAVTPAKLDSLERGMVQKDVVRVLGKPAPGWSLSRNRRGAELDAWYYRTATGGVAAVYFREGRLLAYEEASNARSGTFRR